MSCWRFILEHIWRFEVDAAGKLEMCDYLKLNIHIRNIVAAAVLGQMKNKKLIIFLEEELV